MAENSKSKAPESGAQTKKRGLDPAVWRRLGRYFRPYRGKMAAILGLISLTSLCDLANPLLLRAAIDRFIVPGTLAGIGGYAAVYFGTIAFSMLTVVAFCNFSMVCTG